MEGIITKIVSNISYVKVQKEVIACSLRGKVKETQLLPLVGDTVLIDKEKKVIEKILPRKNAIRRPPVSNITQALVVTSFKNPDFSTNLIDKLLVELEFNKIKPILCFTKKDLITEKEFLTYQEAINYYQKIGYDIYYNDDILSLKKIFKDEITVFVGQTGSGKSTLLNKLDPNLKLKTGEVSIALGRGRHTTRTVEMIELLDGLVLDTPGFSALDFYNMTQQELAQTFIEFKDYPCPYRDCLHINESECAIKKAVNMRIIPKFRYENYLNLVTKALLEKDKYKRK